ncbi:MAG: hypothetical protein AMS16_06975 [Planctomycetes bacterium DG_58]|nr:MAG: hypothetical protein AMS16_06975 [Planctomycetes bacterium DG_58]
MADVVYPSRTDEKLLRIEAPGGEPVVVNMVVPTVTEPGEPFVLKIALADEMGYPSVEYGGSVTVRGNFAVPDSVRVEFEKGRPAVAHLHGVTISEAGLYRFETTLGDRVFHSNPTKCTETPESRIYWGDPHVHTVLSDCMTANCRSLQFCYAAARWFAGLDFVCAADHVSGDRCTLGKWMEQRAACEVWNDPPAFVTLPGYEASLEGGAGGDNNVYFLGKLSMFVDEYKTGNAKTLAEKLRELNPELEFVVVPHHTTRTGKHGEFTSDIYPGPETMPVVEIHSKWGTSEYRGNPNPLKKIHPGPSYVVDLLNQGFPLGFIGGTDTHSTMPAGFGRDHLDKALPGMTAVKTGELTRENVFQAIASRNCYAASLERIYLDVDVAGSPMGRQLPWPDARKSREIRAAAAARSDITRIDLVRCGETIHTHTPHDWQAETTFTDETDLTPLVLSSPYLGEFITYYVRVTCSSGAQGWSSPVWLLLDR